MLSYSETSLGRNRSVSELCSAREIADPEKWTKFEVDQNAPKLLNTRNQAAPDRPQSLVKICDEMKQEVLFLRAYRSHHEKWTKFEVVQNAPNFHTTRNQAVPDRPQSLVRICDEMQE